MPIVFWNIETDPFPICCALVYDKKFECISTEQQLNCSLFAIVWHKCVNFKDTFICEIFLYRLFHQAEEQEEQYKLSDNVYTTAEPRPNAYIPDDDIELPIPRPYGANAPFKPSEPGSTMRHIRKPVPKPIEI